MQAVTIGLVVAADFDVDVLRIGLGPAFQSSLYLRFDGFKRHFGFDADLVADTRHTHEITHGICCRLALVCPVNVARQRDPAALDQNLDSARW